MANREKRKQPIDGSWFRWVCAQRGVSMNGLARLTKWSSTQIRDSVSKEEMTPELLDVCARVLDVHPDYLAGKYCRTLNYSIMDDEEVKRYWFETMLSPDVHPYESFKQQIVNAREHFYDTLLLHGVERDEFKAFGQKEGEEIRRALDRAETEALRAFFPKAKDAGWTPYTFEDAFQDERDVIEFLLDWLVEHGKLDASDSAWTRHDSCDPSN